MLTASRRAVRTYTSLAVIRRALDLSDEIGVRPAAAQLGMHPQTVRKWRNQRTVKGDAWPTPDEIAAWQADDAANADRRARKAAESARRRKRQYLGTAPTLTPATGLTRRVRALYAIGWTCADQAREAGVSKQQITRLLRGDFQRATPATVQRVTTLYRRLSMTVPTDPPPAGRGYVPLHERARRDAARRGYAPPLAWDDDTIDDPNAEPDLGAPPPAVGNGRPAQHVAEDVAFVLDDEPLATTRRVADRLRMTPDAITKALEPDRANRPDLLEQLARNARLATEGVAA